MKQELQEKLFAIEPKWFKRDDIKSSLMAFGFEVGDGWFTLIQQLLEELKWIGLDEGFEIVQVKEKFGGLRFYASGGNEKVYSIISFAERLSNYICEDCGQLGETTSSSLGWMVTLCKKCGEDRRNKRA